MSITQTVEIPANHRLIIDVPLEIPEGPVFLTFTQASSKKSGKIDANNIKISRFFGILSPNTYGDGVAYQRKIRDEWDD